jgi:hypothetical protein
MVGHKPGFRKFPCMYRFRNTSNSFFLARRKKWERKRKEAIVRRLPSRQIRLRYCGRVSTRLCREKCGEDAGTRACGLAAQARVSCNTGLSCLSFSALAPIRDRAERVSVITAQRMLPLQQGRFHPISHILHTTTTCFLSASAS